MLVRRALKFLCSKIFGGIKNIPTSENCWWDNKKIATSEKNIYNAI